MKRLWLFFPVLILLSCLTSRSIQLRVESFSRYEELGYSNIHVIPGNEGIEYYDLEFQEYAAYLYNGMQLIDNRPSRLEEAELVIRLSYENSGPKVISDTKYNWNYDEEKEELHSDPYTVSETIYISTIVLEAYDGEKYANGDLSQIWKTKLIYEDRAGSLRNDFPDIIAGSLDAIGVASTVNSKTRFEYELETLEKIMQDRDYLYLYE